MQIAYAVVVKSVRSWCREPAMTEVRKVEEKRGRELTLHARLGRQDTPRAGPAVLIDCLHIVLSRCQAWFREERAALGRASLLVSRHGEPSPAMCEEGEAAPLTLMQVFLRTSTMSAFRSCGTHCDFQSSPYGTRRRRLPHPPRQGPRPWQPNGNGAPARRDAAPPDQLRQ